MIYYDYCKDKKTGWLRLEASRNERSLKLIAYFHNQKDLLEALDFICGGEEKTKVKF